MSIESFKKMNTKLIIDEAECCQEDIKLGKIPHETWLINNLIYYTNKTIYLANQIEELQRKEALGKIRI